MPTVTAIENVIENVSRRDVLKAGAALTLSITAAGRVFAESTALPDPIAGSTAGATSTASGTPFAPNDFVRISSDDVVTVVSKHLEMGQGIYTGLATLVAEELDARWDQLRVEGAPADAARYANLMLRIQGTGGSTSLSNSFDQFRKAGAVARAMLVSAAAQRWKVPAGEIRVSDGVVSHTSSRRAARFGELVAQAAKLPVPKDVALKDPKDFRYIGKPAHRLDTYAKAHGTAIYTQDVELPGMLTAVVAHPERFGAKVKSFDDTRARAVKGVQAVVAFETPASVGVAVIARDY